jgi:adenylosuccinate synthase
MPVSVIVGGQFGSEGKGKTTLYFAKEQKAKAVVRVGGPNSGHTVLDDNGNIFIFKNLPVASILKDVYCVLTPGNYINLDILLNEISISGIEKDKLIIDPFAMMITSDDIESENKGILKNSIGSTASGTGMAVSRRVQRLRENIFAQDIPELKKYIQDTGTFLRNLLDKNSRIIIEGTQGFGLSMLHSRDYPFTTSRDTTAAGFVSEAGLSPMDVDDIILALRSYPIRVGGESGPIPKEINWDIVTKESGAEDKIIEYTSVTKKIRRIAEFDKQVVKEAINANNPTKVVLNHLDYVDNLVSKKGLISDKMFGFISEVEKSISRKIDYIGIDRKSLINISLEFNKKNNRSDKKILLHN